MNPASITLNWVGRSPAGGQLALLIPFFNEGDETFISRLAYFNAVARDHSAIMDVIIIDDGSTDNSLSQLRAYVECVDTYFYAAAAWPNGKKVGALFATALSITHEFVVLSDFDTDISGFERLPRAVERLRADASLMGFYLRMLPYEGTGNTFLFQQIEYSTHRSIYKIHEKERIVQVMPGAGSCYKREVLIQIFFQHTGLRSGEDREITVVGFRRGYKVFYMKHVLALTRPPLTFRKLVKQRVRWNLGYLETFYKERFFYLEEMGKINVFGLLTFLNFLRVLFLVCFPWLVLATAVLAISYLPWLLAATYLGYLANVVFWMWVSPAESAEIGKKRWKAVMLFPFYAVGVESLAWTRALLVFRRKTVLNRIENVKHAEHVVAS